MNLQLSVDTELIYKHRRAEKHFDVSVMTSCHVFCFLNLLFQKRWMHEILGDQILYSIGVSSPNSVWFTIVNSVRLLFFSVPSPSKDTHKNTLTHRHTKHTKTYTQYTQDTQTQIWFGPHPSPSAFHATTLLAPHLSGSPPFGPSLGSLTFPIAKNNLLIKYPLDLRLTNN